MKKHVIWALPVLSFLLLCLLLPVSVSAEKSTKPETYPMACSANQFEVARLNKNGSFDKISCTADISKAKEESAKLGSEGVIRHSSSTSPTHIIAVNNGIAITCPYRNDSDYAYIRQFASDIPGMVRLPVQGYEEVLVLGLESYENGDGIVPVLWNGFEGYMNSSDLDLIPATAIENGISMVLGGSENTGFQEDAMQAVPVQSYYSVETDGKYTDLVFHPFHLFRQAGNASDEEAYAISPAAEWMKPGERYYSYDGRTFYSDSSCTEKAGIYYPYYQFLPLRTKTRIDASVFDAYLGKKRNGETSVLTDSGELFLRNGETYGMNALLVYAMALLESANGKSIYAKERNNLFAIPSYQSNPDQMYRFSSIDACIKEMMAVYLRSFLHTESDRFFGSHLGNKGSGINVKYSADPYWGMKIASIAYAIDKESKNQDGTLTDFNAESLGVIKENASASILNEAGGKPLYSSTYGTSYQKDHMVTVLSEVGSYHRVQSTDLLNMEEGTVLSVYDQGLYPYDWDACGYLNKTQVQLVNQKNTVTAASVSADGIQVLVQAGFEEGSTLTLEGTVSGFPFDTKRIQTISCDVSLLDETFEPVKTVAAKVNGEEGILCFTCGFDLRSLEKGIYFIHLDLRNSDDPKTAKDTYLSMEEISFTSEGITYELESRDSLSILRVEEAKCETGAVYDQETNSCVCMEGYQTDETGACVVSSAKGILLSSVETIRSVDDAKLAVTGYGFLTGLDAKQEDEVHHVLYLEDLRNGKRTAIEAETTALKEPMDLKDGHVYAKILYSAVIDLSKLQKGCYRLVLEVQNGLDRENAPLLTNRVIDLSDRMVNGVKARIISREQENGQLELIYEKNDIDFSKITKPSKRSSLCEIRELLLEANVLTLSGTVQMFGSSVSVKDSIQLLLVDERGKVYPFDASLSDVKGDQASFHVNQDLSALNSGEYRMYIDVTFGTYRDIAELEGGPSFKPVSSEPQEKEITVNTDRVHNRYQVIVLDKSLAH